MTMIPALPPVVFIAYSPCESAEHTASVVAFATLLRTNGVNALLDIWDRSGIATYGVHQWAAITMARAEKVLVIGTASMFNTVTCPGFGNEHCQAYRKIMADDMLRTNAGENVKYTPVVLAEGSDMYIPALLQTTIAYHMPDAFDDMLRRIFSVVPDQEALSSPPPPPIGSAPEFLKTTKPDWKAIVLSNDKKTYDDAIETASKLPMFRVDDQGNTLLHHAASAGAVHFLRYLNQSSRARYDVAQTMSRRNFGACYTPYHVAVIHGNKDFLRLFRNLDKFVEAISVRDGQNDQACDIAVRMYPDDMEMRWLAGDVHAKWPPTSSAPS